MPFESIPILYPYRDVQADEIDEEGLDELLSELETKADGQASTTEPQDNRIG